MTETDIPLLGPGRELTQAASQTVMTIGSALRERRFALGRSAWSDDRAADHVVQAHRRAADPPVRTMSEAEFDLFRREGTAGRAGFETRQTHGAHGDVRVTVGPMPEGRGWGLAAEAHPADAGVTGEAARAQACVVARSETDAKELADELLVGGHTRVQRLHEFGEYAARRAAQARTEVRETREQLIQRTADAVRRQWQADPDLAERMIQPQPGDRQTGQAVNGALGALAHELEKLEDRGYAMGDVLSRIGRTQALRRADNPAAMACSFVRRLSPDLRVINLDDVTADQPDRSESPRHADPAPGDRARRAASPPAESVAAAEQALDAALRAGQLTGVVRNAPGYPRLRTLLAEQHAQGRDLDPLLSRLPTGRLGDADDPAAYLRAVVESRLAADPLRKSRPGLYAATELVERCLPREASRAVIECESWPGLAARLDRWRADGLPVTTMLESLSPERVRTASRPALFVGALLNAKATSHRKQQHPRREAGSAAGHTVPPDWPAGPEPAPAPRPAPAPPRRAVEAGAAEAVLDIGPAPTAIPLPPASIDQLDPSSAVDRVALHATRGTGDPEQDAAIDRLLTTSSRATGDSMMSGAPSAHADSERDRAEVADRAAAYAASTPDDPATAEREDLSGGDHAHAADREADHARAVADTDADTAAAARAGLSYRAPEATSGPERVAGRSPIQRPTSAARHEPVPQVTPALGPVRTARPRR